MSNCECKNRKTSFCIFPECQRKTGAFGRKVRTFNHDSQKHIQVGDQRIYQRSHWEGNFARVLEYHRATGEPFDGMIIHEWAHEPRTFMFDPGRANEVWKLYKRKLTGIRKGTTSYKPDFRIIYAKPETAGSDLLASVATFQKWYEVKGHYENKDFTKIKRMKQYWPEVDIEFIDKGWFTIHARRYRSLVPDWEPIKL